MKAFRYRKYCAKGFFSKIIIMESICLGKKAKKMRKSIFLITELESEKVIEFRPPLFFNFMGDHTSSTFSNSFSFKRDFLAIFVGHFPSTIMISQKNPFAQYFLYLKAFI